MILVKIQGDKLKRCVFVFVLLCSSMMVPIIAIPYDIPIA